MSSVTSTCAELCIFFIAIISFISDNPAFYTGMSSVLSIGLRRLINHAKQKAKEKTHHINTILSNYDIDMDIPDMGSVERIEEEKKERFRKK